MELRKVHKHHYQRLVTECCETCIQQSILKKYAFAMIPKEIELGYCNTVKHKSLS